MNIPVFLASSAAFIFSIAFPAVTAGLILLFIVITLVNKCAAPEDKKLMLLILAAVIIVKILIMSVYFYFWLLPGNYDMIGPDGEVFSRAGWYMAKALSGNLGYSTPTNEFVFKDFAQIVDQHKDKPLFLPGLFTSLIGAIYFLFGYVPLLIKGFNIFFSACSSVIVYMIAVQIYGRKIARISFLIFTFFPSVFLFSISALRDPLIILLSLFVIYMLLQFNKSPALRNFLFLSAALALIAGLRIELFVIMALTSLIVILVNSKIKFLLRVLLVSGIFLVLMADLLIFGKIIKPGSIKNIAPAILSKAAVLGLREGRLTYKLFPDSYYEKSYRDRITLAELLKFMPKSILFYFIMPMPFILGGISYMIISLQMLWWYALLVLSVLGFFKARLLPIYPILIYISVVVVTTCLIYVNGGLLIRHRDGIVPFIIIFASAGMAKISEMFQDGIRR